MKNLSLKYQVLSSQTAFVGVVKQKNKSADESVKVDLNDQITFKTHVIKMNNESLENRIKKEKKRNQRSSGAYGAEGSRASYGMDM